MRDIERGHHGDALGNVAFGPVGDLVHLLVDIGNGRLQCLPFFGRTGDPVFLCQAA